MAELDQKKQDDYHDLLNRSMRYLSVRSRTKQELLSYLARTSAKLRFTLQTQQLVLNELIKLGYVNDEAFVNEYISARIRNKQRGRRRLSMELKQKGVSDTLIEDYFSQNPFDEPELAKTALSKVWGRFAGLDKLKKRYKATQFLLRRGFSYDAIRKTVEEMIKKE